MNHAAQDLERFLDDLARGARSGDQLPTIRGLMQRFGVSQAVVQRAFGVLKDRGAIESQVGRGTYFTGGAATSPAGSAADARPAAAAEARPSGPRTNSVLLLRRSISIARGRALVEGLQRRFAADGHRVLELSYTDTADALTVLKALPRQDAGVVQSSFRTISIELLAALRDKCAVLAVDGAALVGADVDAVGTEWGEPLGAAVALLRRRGHRRMAVAGTSLPLLAMQLAWRRLDHIVQTQPDLSLEAIALPHAPDEAYAEALIERLCQCREQHGVPPITALVAWGIEDGERFRARLREQGFDVPGTLSVVLLGRTDLANEHAGFFNAIGCSVDHQAQALHEVIVSRWAQPERPFGIFFTPVTQREGASVADAPVPAHRPVAAASRGRQR